MKEKVPLQRVEKLSLATPLPGPPEPQSWLMLASQVVKVGLPLRPMLLKYSARNCPDAQVEDVIGKLTALDVPPLGL